MKKSRKPGKNLKKKAKVTINRLMHIISSLRKMIQNLKE